MNLNVMTMIKPRWVDQRNHGFPRSLCTCVAASRPLQSNVSLQDLIMLGIETSCDDTGVAVVWKAYALFSRPPRHCVT